MPETLIRITYPPTLIGEPVMSRLIRTFDLAVNIVQASITTEQGWIEVSLEGEPAALAAAKAWLEQQGLDVLTIHYRDEG